MECRESILLSTWLCGHFQDSNSRLVILHRVIIFLYHAMTRIINCFYSELQTSDSSQFSFSYLESFSLLKVFVQLKDCWLGGIWLILHYQYKLIKLYIQEVKWTYIYTYVHLYINICIIYIYIYNQEKIQTYLNNCRKKLFHFIQLLRLEAEGWITITLTVKAQNYILE